MDKLQKSTDVFAFQKVCQICLPFLINKSLAISRPLFLIFSGKIVIYERKCVIKEIYLRPFYNNIFSKSKHFLNIFFVLLISY